MKFTALIEIAADDDADSSHVAKRIEQMINTRLNKSFEEVEVNVEVDE